MSKKTSDNPSDFRLEIGVEVGDANDLVGEHENRIVECLESGQERRRILVVDDKPSNRALLLRMLEAVGFVVREAADGAEAVRLVEQWSPHLILMDMRMPVMDGFEATRRIKVGKHSEVKIIAMTAHAFEEDKIRILAAGCDDFIPKPFREHELFEAIRNHLGVRYIYEDDDSCSETGTKTDAREDLSPDALAVLDPELPAELKQAIITGSPDRIADVLDNIRIDDPALADMLEKLVDGFEYAVLVP
ncbi:MAG: response regulator [Desulfobacterales bacterium]|nr:response regulator [Desulfobacterales bacterium]